MFFFTESFYRSSIRSTPSSIILTILNYTYLCLRSFSKTHLCKWVKEDMRTTPLKNTYTRTHIYSDTLFTIVKRALAKQIHSANKSDLALRIHHLLSGSHF